MSKSSNTEGVGRGMIPSGAQGSAAAGATATAAAVPTSAAVRRSDETADVKGGEGEMEGLMSLADELAGIGGADDVKDEPEEQKPASPTAAKPDKAESEESEEEELNPDGPVLLDDDEEEDDGKAGAAGDEENEREGKSPEEVVKILDKKLFKHREKRRELESKLADTEKREQELKEKLAQATVQPQGVAQGLGSFAQAKTDADVATIETTLEQQIEWLEDRIEEGGYEGKDGGGRDVNWDKAQLREFRRNAREELKLADVARARFKTLAESDAKARQKYPFVFDTGNKHHGRVAKVLKEAPGLEQLPNKAMLLGRLTIGEMVESGEYMLVKRGKKAPAAKTEAKPNNPTPPAPPATQRRPEAKKDDLQQRIAAGDSAALEEWAEGLID